jgi:hypothetical protein
VGDTTGKPGELWNRAKAPVSKTRPPDFSVSSTARSIWPPAGDQDEVGDLPDEFRENLARKKKSMSHTGEAEERETLFRKGKEVVLSIGAWRYGA